MRPRRSFRPTLHDELESRIALHAAGSATAALIAEHAHSQSPRHAKSNRASAKIARIYDSFTVDYLEAQQVYFKALATPGTDASVAKSTFRQYTVQRGGLLAQQLVPIVGHVPGALVNLRPSERSALGNAASTPLQSFLIRRITGGPNNTFSDALVPTLVALIPPVGTGDGTADLFRLSARNAIQTARTNTLNVLGILRSGVFAPENSH